MPLAIKQLRDELEPARDERQLQEIAALLGRQIGLLRMNSSAEQKEDWINFALMDLREMPFGFVIEALNDIRPRVKFEGEVIPLVWEYVVSRAPLRRRYLRIAERLAEIAR